jgi:hypothetical protein
MEDEEFWSIIDASRRRARNDPEAHIETLTVALGALPEEEIIAFDGRFHEFWVQAYTWDLWAAAYIIGGGCSDDGFMDFRGWLVSKGQKVYETALADPESLLRVVDDVDGECQIEGFQYAAPAAWAEKAGSDEADFPVTRGCVQPENPSGEPWEEDDLPHRFPKLWRKFAE